MPKLIPVTGPCTVKPLISAVMEPVTEIISLVPVGLLTSTLGAWMIVVPEPAPVKVRFLLITTCSVYVPAATLIVSPDEAAVTAAWIVV